jgi:glycerol-3-phosphate dehydrogenase (NAD+)
MQAELLNGQKLQGVLTSNEVQSVLKLRGWERDYPLMSVINGIVQEKLPPDAIFRFGEADEMLEL